MRSSLYTALSLLSFALTQASALPGPSPAIVARGAGPSAALQARAPEPSAAKRSSRTKRQQTPLSPAEEMSRALCPFGMSVCPIPFDSPTTVGVAPFIHTSLTGWIEEGFECADFGNDLTSCGGCGSVSASYDCTSIPNALGVSCMEGGCRVHTCKAGFTLSADGKTCVRAQ